MAPPVCVHTLKTMCSNLKDMARRDAARRCASGVRAPLGYGNQTLRLLASFFTDYSFTLKPALILMRGISFLTLQDISNQHPLYPIFTRNLLCIHFWFQNKQEMMLPLAVCYSFRQMLTIQIMYGRFLAHQGYINLIKNTVKNNNIEKYYYNLK